jgi:hypothetical protein
VISRRDLLKGMDDGSHVLSENSIRPGFACPGRIVAS